MEKNIYTEDLNLKSSTKIMSQKLAIFYHLYQTELSGLIYQQQMHRLRTSGLMDDCEFIHIGTVGDNELFSLPSKATVHKNVRLKCLEQFMIFFTYDDHFLQ